MIDVAKFVEGLTRNLRQGFFLISDSADQPVGATSVRNIVARPVDHIGPHISIHSMVVELKTGEQFLVQVTSLDARTP